MNGDPAPGRKAAGIVVIVLASAVGLVLVVFAVAAAIAIDDKHLMLSDIEVSFLATTVGAVIGALGTYLGIGRGVDLAAASEPPSPPEVELPPVAPPDLGEVEQAPAA